MFNTLDDVQNELQKYYALSHTRMGDDNALERMKPLLTAAGIPQTRLKVVHVAGTSGKTSTCYYIAALLRASGKNVGLTVSPYIETVLERIQINGHLISENEFCKSMSEFLGLVEKLEQKPGYFEVMIGFSLWYFDKIGVDYVVLETGVGGMYDSTNVIERTDKVCVITDIGLDHMQVLGDTVEKIAWQKAGIIQRQNHVFTHQQLDSVMEIIVRRINEQEALGHYLTDFSPAPSGTVPLFQQRNWHLARAIAEYVAMRDGLTLNDTLLPEDIVVPGRMELCKQADGSILVLDGAHNEQKMAALVESFKVQFHDQKAAILVAFKNDKEFKKALEILAPIAHELIVTRLDGRKSAGKIVTTPASEVAEYAHFLGISVEVDDDVAAAYEQLLSKTDQLKVVTGSLYLVGAVKNLIEDGHETS